MSGFRNKIFDHMNSFLRQQFLDICRRVFNKYLIKYKMKRNQSKLQNTGTCDVSKSSLSYFDNNRHMLDDGNKSLA